MSNPLVRIVGQVSLQDFHLALLIAFREPRLAFMRRKAVSKGGGIAHGLDEHEIVAVRASLDWHLATSQKVRVVS